MWYMEPGWWAFAVSIFSIGLSVVALRTSRRGVRSTIERDLIQRAADINEGFLRHDVRGPYAHLLKVPESRRREFTAKAVMLLHHINLLREVFEHRDVLDPATKKATKDGPAVSFGPGLRQTTNYARYGSSLETAPIC